jgi:hypothetical protein
MKKNQLLNAKEKILSYLYFCRRNKNSRKVLILSATGNAHGLSYPFHFYRQELATEFNFHFEEHISNSLNEKLNKIRVFKGDIIFVSMPLRVNGEILSRQKVIDFFQSIDSARRFKLVFFDISDNAVSPYFDILPYVDLFLMPFVFRDQHNYEKPFKGGNIMADYLAGRFQLATTAENGFHEGLFLSRPKMDQIYKIMPYWNWMLWRSMVKAFKGQNYRCILNGQRNIDVTCRFTQYEGWCRFHRLHVCERLAALSPQYAIVATKDKVDLKSYYRELESSRISFSPFGYGEICPKDFEAIMKGCLLFKPSVEHLTAYPQIHVENETYVPVAWDLADLEEKITYYLERPEEQQRIAANAARAYERFFAECGFLAKIEEILRHLEK